MPVLPALGRLRHEGHEFKDDLGYIVIPCLSEFFFFLQDSMFVKILLMAQDMVKQMGATSTHGGNSLPPQICFIFQMTLFGNINNNTKY